MNTRNVHKASEMSRQNSEAEDEVSPSSSRDEDDKLGFKPNYIRWFISCLQASPLRQRFFVLRKYYVVLLVLLAVVSLYSIQNAIQRKTGLRAPFLPWPLPSETLRHFLPPLPLDQLSVKPTFDAQSTWPRASFFAEIPSVDDPLWPPLPESTNRSSNPTTITTCVPGLAKDIYDESKVSNFLRINQRQKVRAKELIFLFSDVNAILDENKVQGVSMTGEQWCFDAQKSLQDYHPNLKIVCVGERITAGRARNVLATVATSDVLAYIDTDDQEEPERNLVIQQLFDCHPKLKVFIHSNYGTGHGLYGKVRYHPYDSQVAENAAPVACPDEQEGVEVIRGLALHEMLDQTQDVLKFGIRTVGGMRPGHLVVKRDVIRYVRSSSIYKGQDTLWLRDIIYMYGRRDDTAMFINRPLTTYYQSSHSFKVNVKK